MKLKYLVLTGLLLSNTVNRIVNTTPSKKPNKSNTQHSQKATQTKKPALIKAIKTQEEFKKEVTNSKIPVVVKFHAPWCGPCKTLKKSVEELAKEFKNKIKVIEIDIDQAPRISRQFNVMSVPTTVFFFKGKETERVIGAKSKNIIRQKIQKLLKK